MLRILSSSSFVLVLDNMSRVEWRTFRVWLLTGICAVVAALTPADGQTNSANQPSTNQLAPGARAEQIRTACVEGRRYVCGKVLQVTPEGLVVDSGYPDLLNPPFNKSWVARGTASINRPPQLLEEKRPDAICVGVVFLTGIPKKPEVHEYDYVVLHAYPAGQYQYKPVPGVEKTVRRFSGSLELAVKLNSQS
jgi:hypothetical protein